MSKKPPYYKLRTKIICTAGPSIDTEKKIEDLVLQGMSLVRLNCSHGNHKTRLGHIRRVRRVEKKLQRPIGIMLDLQGPKLRVAELEKPLVLHSGDVWKMSFSEAASQDKKVIPVGFKNLAQAVSVGGRIYMDDGLIRVEIVKKNKKDVWVKVLHGGYLESRKGVNIPFYKGSLPVLSKKDKEDLLWGLKQNINFVALSFVRHANDIVMLKKLIQKHHSGHQPLVIAKIEKPEAVKYMDEIISVCDGILVARGDLGIELSMAKVPVIQKQLIEKCRLARKPVIIATQMLDSMRHQPIPTRAEVSDIASAIYAGADAVLLTGETSSGQYPVEATRTLRKVIMEVEDHMVSKTFRKMPRDFGLSSYKEAFLFNAMQLASDIDAKAIVMLTRHGHMTKTISKLHPKQPVFSLALNQSFFRELTLFWGVSPIEMTGKKLIEQRIEAGLEVLRFKKVIKKSDRIIFIFRDYKSENLNLKIVDC